MINTTSSNSADAMKTAINRQLIALRTCIPAVADSEPYKDGQVWVIDAIPAVQTIQEKDGEREYIDVPKISKIPIVLPGCENLGLSITMPIYRGDDVILLISDRSLDFWQAGGKIQRPADETEIRHHDLSDALCIPNALTIATLSEYNQDAIQLGSPEHNIQMAPDDMTVNAVNVTINAEENCVINCTNSTVNASESADINCKNSTITAEESVNIVCASSSVTASQTATITAPIVTVNASNKMDINTPNLNVSGNINGSGNLSISGNGDIGGDLSVTGSITGASVTAPSISAGTSLTVAGKEQSNHIHSSGSYSIGTDSVSGNSGTAV